MNACAACGHTREWHAKHRPRHRFEPVADALRKEAATTRLKMWIGNLDGSRQGLVIAPSKQRARAIVRTGRTDFDDYWYLQASVDADLEPETLYTRPFAHSEAAPWQRGLCPLPKRLPKRP